MQESVDFVIAASEFSGAGFDRVCEFRAREAFRLCEMPPVRLSPGLLLDEEEFRIVGAVLDHGIPCLLPFSRRSCASTCGANTGLAFLWAVASRGEAWGASGRARP